MKSLFDGYSRKESSAIQFLRADYRDQSQRIASVAAVAKKKIEPAVIEQLLAINSGASAEANRNLQKLKSGKCAVAISGQQLGALGGPLFTFYKILTVVAAARQLEAESKVSVVPVFWLQSEDHDFEEISQAKLFLQGETLSSFDLGELKSLSGDRVGRIIIDKAVSAKLEKLLGQATNIDAQVRQILSDSYSSGKTLAAAFCEFWKSVCSELGVLFFDADSKAIKSLSSPLIKRFFKDHQAISDLLQANSLEMQAAGYNLQVPIKSTSPLFFISHNGKRQRFNFDGEYFTAEDLRLNSQQLEDLISKEADLFSPSALARPILQDFLFPTALYVSGPAEFNYWGQLKELYQFFELVQPIVAPRASFLILEDKYERLMAKAGVDINSIFDPVEKIIASRFAATEYAPENLLDINRRQIDQQISSLRDVFARVDGNLLGPLEQTASNVHAAFSRLIGRYQRSLVEREDVVSNQIKRIQAVLQPMGQQQERLICASSYLLKYGLKFREQALAQIQPFADFETRILRLKADAIFEGG